MEDLADPVKALSVGDEPPTSLSSPSLPRQKARNMGHSDLPGAVIDDPNKPSLAKLPWELQLMILEAASTVPQILFVSLDAAGRLSVNRPVHYGLASACRLSRSVYLMNKTHGLALPTDKPTAKYHVDPERDIFYLCSDKIAFGHSRPALKLALSLVDRKLMRNAAVDVTYLGAHPRHEGTIRIWDVFPNLNTLHIFVRKDRDASFGWTDTSLVVEDITDLHVIKAPMVDSELWYAVRWQMNRLFERLVRSGGGFDNQKVPGVVGHLVCQSRKPEDDW